jgi:hypothetical protein
MTIFGPVSFTIFAVSVIVMVIGFGPHENVMMPPLATPATTAALVQLAPTVQRGRPAGQRGRQHAHVVGVRAAVVVAARGEGNDHVGAFAVTAGIGVDEIVKALEKEHDDYGAILVKSLADRLAEAFAEMLHQRARRDWGYGAAENLSAQDLVDENYREHRQSWKLDLALPDGSQIELFTFPGAPAADVVSISPAINTPMSPASTEAPCPVIPTAPPVEDTAPPTPIDTP